MEKPTIIAICGMTASGKDTLARALYERYKRNNIDVHIVVSDTTRPIRENEVDGRDYNFINLKQFYERIDNDYYLEYACFRNWFYGTPLNELNEICEVTIAVLNRQGIIALLDNVELNTTFNIVVIYLETSVWEAVQRSIKRENKFRLEYLRRIKADLEEFKDFKEILNTYLNNHLYFHSENVSLFTSCMLVQALVDKSL